MYATANAKHSATSDWFRHDLPPPPAPRTHLSTVPGAANRSTADDWFKHEQQQQQQQQQPYSARGGSTHSPRIAAVETRLQLQEQIIERQQHKELQKQRENSEMLASLSQERELHEEQKRREALELQEKKLRWKLELDAQVTANSEKKRRQQQEKSQELGLQQDSLSLWQREQDQRKHHKQAEFARLALQRKLELAELENHKRLEQLKRREEERHQLSEYNAVLDAQDSSRKQFFSKLMSSNGAAGASSLYKVEKASLAHEPANPYGDHYQASLPPYDVFDDKVSRQQLDPTVQVYSSSAQPNLPRGHSPTHSKDKRFIHDLLVQMQEKKHRHQQIKEEERAFAASMHAKLQASQQEEEARRRQAADSNHVYRGFLEQQMQQHKGQRKQLAEPVGGRWAAAHSMESSAALAQQYDSVSKLVNSTRPW